MTNNGERPFGSLEETSVLRHADSLALLTMEQRRTRPDGAVFDAFQKVYGERSGTICRNSFAKGIEGEGGTFIHLDFSGRDDYCIETVDATSGAVTPWELRRPPYTVTVGEKATKLIVFDTRIAEGETVPTEGSQGLGRASFRISYLPGPGHYDVFDLGGVKSHLHSVNDLGMRLETLERYNELFEGVTAVFLGSLGNIAARAS